MLKLLNTAMLTLVISTSPFAALACSPIPEMQPRENESMEHYRVRLWKEKLQSKEIKNVFRAKVIRSTGHELGYLRKDQPWLVYVETIKLYKGMRPSRGVLRVVPCERGGQPGEIILVATNEEYVISFSNTYSAPEDFSAVEKAIKELKKKKKKN
jgi:hypothetical protein